MVKIGDYNTIMNDRNLFNQIVYTPLSEALRILEERRNDKVLVKKVEELLKGEMPLVFKEKKCAVLCRQVATPNNENRRFIALAKESNLHPVFFEYHDDKFNSQNTFKHSLGQIHMPKSAHKNNEVEKVTIIDFNKHNGKKLREIKTLWEEPLIDFHKRLFVAHGYNIEDFDFPDVSHYFKGSGKKVVDYYTNIFILFTCFGVLFENFLTSKDDEGDFTRTVVLPTIEKVLNKVGVKPIIVPLEPLDMEAEHFWYHHLPTVKEHLPNNI